MAQLVECLPICMKPWVQFLILRPTYTGGDGIPHSGRGESEVGSHPLLRNKLETDSLGHMRLYLKKIK